MKTLYIMRHSQKKEMKNNEDDHFDLELSEKGIQQTYDIANRLKELTVYPDLIVASPAMHTRQTAQIIKEVLEHKKNVMYNEVLYQAFLNELIETISYTFDSVNELFIVGHNPSLAMLAYNFVSFKQEFDYGNVLKIEFNCNSWIDIENSNAKLIWIEKPN